MNYPARNIATPPNDEDHQHNPGHRLGAPLSGGGTSDGSDVGHVKRVVDRALANNPDELYATIATYAGALALAKSSGRKVELHLAPDAEGGINATLTVPDSPAITRALARGSERVAEILAGGEMLTGEQFALLAGVTRQTLNDWRLQRRVLALSGAKRGFRFPKWQIVEASGTILPGLSELHRVLDDQPWSVYRFLTQRHASLDDRTGIESLQSGNVDATIATARGLFDTYT